jgi:hypothetical protein
LRDILALIVFFEDFRCLLRKKPHEIDELFGLLVFEAAVVRRGLNAIDSHVGSEFSILYVQNHFQFSALS